MGAQELVEEGILVSPRMMADHMPDYLTAVLRRMAHKSSDAIARGGASRDEGPDQVYASPCSYNV